MANAAGPDPAWEQIFRSRQWGKYPPEHLVRFVAGNFYGAPNRGAVHLLEIGCGPGANVWFMAREGFTVSAIDGSPTAISLAGERLASEGLTADLRVGDFFSLPWPDRQLRRRGRERQPLLQSLGPNTDRGRRGAPRVEAGCAVPVILLQRPHVGLRPGN